MYTRDIALYVQGYGEDIIQTTVPGYIHLLDFYCRWLKRTRQVYTTTLYYLPSLFLICSTIPLYLHNKYAISSRFYAIGYDTIVPICIA